MIVKIWGCRGSLTTAGPEVVRYGGYTTCVEVRLEDGTLLVIDAGSGIHPLGRSLLAEKGAPHEMHLLLTHSHWDHLTGFPFFGPAYLEGWRIHVRGGPDAKESLAKYLRHQMDPPYFPVEFDRLKASFDFEAGPAEGTRIGSATIVPFPLSHPNGGYGYRIDDSGRSFVFLTDNEPDFPHAGGLAFEDYVKIARGADLLLHDAQYNDEEYERSARGWGHCTYRRAALAAVEAGVKRFGTFHHDPDHDDREVDRGVRVCRGVIRERRARVECFGAAQGMTIKV
jgi:phosphoribosyl 1,2-cyclic phosphodiesterase